MELDSHLELAFIIMDMNLLCMYFEGSLKYVPMNMRNHGNIKGMKKWFYPFTDMAPQA